MPGQSAEPAGENASALSAGVVCPECGSDDVARASALLELRWRPHQRARCLVCGTRFSVRDVSRDSLRVPELGERGETAGDVYEIMLRAPMRRPHALLVVACLIAGLSLGIALAIRFGIAEIAAAFLPTTFGAWWIGRWLWPAARQRIPGKCARCGYPLRGAQRCSECGTPSNSVL